MTEALGEVAQAADRYRDRKAAAGLLHNSHVQTMEQLRVMLSDLDLDMEELEEFAHRVIAAATVQASHGIPAPSIVGGAWIDGLITGMMLMESRVP